MQLHRVLTAKDESKLISPMGCSVVLRSDALGSMWLLSGVESLHVEPSWKFCRGWLLQIGCY